MANKNLKNIKSPAIHKRKRTRRKTIRAFAGESAGRAVGPLTPGCEIYGFTKGQFSLIDLIEHCLTCTGPADVFIATWSAAAGDIKRAHKFLSNGRIRSLRFLVDYSFKSRKPEFCQELLATFGPDAVRVTVTHAKYVLIRNASWNLVIRTSMNLNYNPRFENFEISDDIAFAEFQQAIIDEVWSGQDAAEGFEVRPQDNKEKFRKAFQKQGSIFGETFNDARDLI
ncbi:MAG: hypothetical protein GY841_12580 [FCB group bacterium]|nr:hypothetical protein [FCB group bacterium]